MTRVLIVLSILLLSACNFAQDEDFQSDAEGFEQRLQQHNFFQILDATNIQARINHYNLVQKDINKYQPSRLNEENQKILAKLQETVQHRVWTLNTFKPYQWNPTTYNLMPHFQFIYNDTIQESEKSKRLIQLLKQVPEYYEAAKSQIQHPTLFHTQLAIQQQEDAYFFFKDELSNWLNTIDAIDIEKNNVNFHRQKVLLSVKDFLGFLNSKINNADDGTPQDSLSTVEAKKVLYAKQYSINNDTLSVETFNELLLSN